MINLKQNIQTISGTNQNDRTNEFLNPDYFRIFDFNLGSFITQALGISKLVAFYNNNDELDGTWYDILSRDTTINIIMLKELDLEIFNEKLLNDIYKCNKSIDIKYRNILLKEIITNCISIFKKIDNCQLILSKNQHNISNLLNNKISEELSYFLNILEEIKEKINYNKLLYRFSSKWHYQRLTKKNSLNKLISLLNKDINILISSLQSIKDIAKSEYNKINNSGNVEPHIGLLLTFQKILSISEKKLNNINKKHIDFYYKNILEYTKLKPKPYTANIQINLSNNIEEFIISKGELLTAGKGLHNEDIIYKTIQETNITSSDIEKIFTIDYTSNNLDFESSVNYFLLEKNKTNSNIINSEIGFSFGAEILNLNAGNRKVDLIINIENHSFNQLISDLYENLLDDINDYTDEIINQEISDIFDVKFSNNEHWINSDAQQTRINSEQNNVIISFIVNNDSPEITTLKDNDMFSEEFPIISCTLNNKYHHLNYIFSKIQINNLTVNVEIINLKDIDISNDLGKLNTDVPFQIFGPKPIIGSSFTISNNIINKYLIEDIKLNLEWFNLPKDEGGFYEYYQDYFGIENNDSFKVKLSAFVNNDWQPINDKQVINLFSNLMHSPYEDFEEINQNEIVSAITRINNIDIEAISLNKKSINNDIKIKLELCYPSNGFGHDQYPDLVRINSLKSTKKKILPLPNEPYTPTLRSISIDIKYSQTFNKNDNNFVFYHNYPFLKNKTCLSNLLPNINRGSSLYIKLSKKASSITFQIILNKGMANNKNNLIYSVFKNTEWVNLKNEEVLVDTTNNLSSSGFITLDLSRFYKLDNSLCKNSDKIWIKISCKNSKNFNYLINKIIPNSIPVRSDNTEIINNNGLFIEDFLKPKKQISNIKQINEASGGSLIENEQQFYTRISENLKHKNRAISITDYEKILLEEFKDIFAVYGIKNHDVLLNFIPGNITLVLVKKFKNFSEENNRPELFTHTELEKMKSFLKNMISPNAEVNIINPKYEIVQTKFNVIFKKGVNKDIHVKKLRQLIISFLSPWVEDKNKKITTKNYINTTQIINFIEKINFVDKIMNFNLFHVVDNKIINLANAHENNCTITPKHIASILVPHEKHIISTYDDNDYSDQHGINNIMIDTDFIIEEIERPEISGINNMIVAKNFRIKDESTLDKNEIDTFVLRLNL